MQTLITLTSNICAVLAHTLLLESKGSEPLGEAWVLAKDPPAQPTPESTNEMMRALQENLPGYMETVRKEIVPTEQEQLKGAQSVSKGYADLTADIYDTTGRRLNTIGEEIAASNQLAKAKSDAEVLAGPGMDIIKNADAAQRMIDPEFYKMKEATGRTGAAILDSFGPDPGALSGSEREEISRGLAQQGAERGTFGAPSQIETVANATRFGQASNNRRQQAAQTVGALAPAITATRSNVDVLQQATGRPGQNNSGAPLISGAREAGQNAFSQGQALMQQTGENQRTAMNINANRRSGLDLFNQTASSLSQCCFIFMEAQNGLLPWWVRAHRDLCYEREPHVAKGYKRCAKLLVPLMQRSALIRELVNEVMVKPLTMFGGWLYSAKGFEQGKRYASYKNFWFAVWRMLGKF